MCYVCSICSCVSWDNKALPALSLAPIHILGCWFVTALSSSPNCLSPPNAYACTMETCFHSNAGASYHPRTCRTSPSGMCEMGAKHFCPFIYMERWLGHPSICTVMTSCRVCSPIPVHFHNSCIMHVAYFGMGR